MDPDSFMLQSSGMCNLGWCAESTCFRTFASGASPCRLPSSYCFISKHLSSINSFTFKSLNSCRVFPLRSEVVSLEMQLWKPSVVEFRFGCG